MNLMIKSVEKQKALDKKISIQVPNCLHKYIDGDLANFEMLQKNPGFLMKTLTVCQDCYLKITEFSEVAGAVGGSKIKEGGKPDRYRINQVQ